MRRRGPRCLGCDIKPARPDSFFCSHRCGHTWAEGYISCGEVAFCERCGVGAIDSSISPCAHCDYEPEKETER